MAYSQKVVDRFESVLNEPEKHAVGRFDPTDPNVATGILTIEAIRQVADVNKSYQQNADAPVRFLPCLTAGLAYYMSLKRNGLPETRIALLKSNYEK